MLVTKPIYNSHYETSNSFHQKIFWEVLTKIEGIQAISISGFFGLNAFLIHCATWLTFECYLKLQYNIEDNLAQTREQTLVPDLYVLTVVFLALKKFGFSEIRNSSPLIFYFFNLFSMQFFSADATMFSIISFFFAH